MSRAFELALLYTYDSLLTLEATSKEVGVMLPLAPYGSRD